MLFKKVLSVKISKPKITVFTLSFIAAILYYVMFSDWNRYQGYQPLISTTTANAFLINTKGCSIPYFNHFHPTVTKFYKKVDGEFVKCDSVNVLIAKGNKIFLDERVFLRYFGNVSLSCVYREIERNPKDSEIDADRKIGYEAPKTLVFGKAINAEYIKVECYSNGNKLFHNFIALLALKSSVERRCRSREEFLSPERLNIILLAIDSVSKLNFLRHFNRTYEYLRNTLQVFEFQGHTKVADNTFVNMMPMLTGHFYDFYRTDEELKTKYFDDVDFIWKEYASIGYRTFYLEESANTGTFTYFKKGFRYPPTDYYLRPFTLAAEGKAKYGCIDSKPEIHFLNDHLLKFVRLMNKRPFFAWLFHSRITHDYLNNAGYMDKPMLTELQHLRESGILNTSLLLFFSDHGIRFGKIRETYIGKIEERMPFMFLYLPQWFLDAHPNISKNLEINQKRLTTHFDIYQTLAHMVSIASSKQVKQNMTHGISLFKEIPSNRTCEDAAILPHWCTCHQYVEVSSSDWKVQKAAEVLIETVNDWLRGDSDSCVKLSVDKIIDARISPSYEFLSGTTQFPFVIDIKPSEHVGNNMEFYADFLITVIASPSKALLEGTVRYALGEHKLLDVSRINLYGNQSYCVQDNMLRKFCFCKSLLNAT